ncbi:MAG: GtrA family protein [Spirochaetaceae bacterium]|nr:GtrA family protein [Spirochaetaceae bacterium]
MINIKNNLLYQRYRSLILYIMIGISGLIIDYAGFVILYNILNINMQIAQIIAAHLGFISNFILNAFINFKATNRLGLRALSYYLTSWAGIGIRALSLFIFVTLLSFNTNAVQFLTMGAVVAGQFTFNKYITFRKAKIKE